MELGSIIGPVSAITGFWTAVTCSSVAYFYENPLTRLEAVVKQGIHIELPPTFLEDF